MPKYTDFKPQFAEIAGRRIRYAVAGSGPPVILLHGLGRSVYQWQDHFRELSKTNTVYAFDLPGFGHSEPLQKHERAMFSVSVFIEQFRKHFNIEKPVLLGGSFGGLAALDYALEFGDNISKLILMDSAGLGKEISLVYRLLTLPGVGELWKYFDHNGIEDSEVWVNRFTKVPKFGKILAMVVDYLLTPPPPERLENTIRENRGTPLRLFRYGIGLMGQKQAIRRDNKLRRINVPTLIVWGELDHIFPVEHAHRAARAIPDSKLHIFKKAGHWPPYEEPKEFDRVVKEFIVS